MHPGIECGANPRRRRFRFSSPSLRQDFTSHLVVACGAIGYRNNSDAMAQLAVDRKEPTHMGLRIIWMCSEHKNAKRCFEHGRFLST